MNRRDVLTNLFGAAVVAALPNVPAIETTVSIYTLEDWRNAVIKVWASQMEDLIIYGTCAIRQIDTFPFIESVPVRELYLPTTTRGLFSDNSI